MGTWTEQHVSRAAPRHLLEVLTDPQACGRWAPVDFDVEALGHDRLQAGARARVGGRLAGRRIAFDVDVISADTRRLTLRASGPVALDVEYRLRPLPAGSELSARIAVHGRGLTGAALAHAVGAVLAAGALRSAVAGIAREAEALAAAA